MSKWIVRLCCFLVLTTSAAFSDASFRYNGFGLGASVSTCVLEHYGIGFGTGFHGIIEFSLGPRYGHLQFNPSMLFIFTGEDYTQLSLNYTDVRYLFPIKHRLLRPYAGIGIGIIVNMWEVGNDTDIGLNQFVGIEFKAAPKVAPFIETRLTLTDPLTFRFITGGVTFRF